MKAAANTTITVLRGTETNAYGDEVDSPVSVHTGIPAAILESSRRVYLPAEQAVRVVRVLNLRVGYEVDIRKDDRVRDERSNLTYVITELAQPSVVAGHLPDRTATISLTN